MICKRGIETAPIWYRFSCALRSLDGDANTIFSRTTDGSVDNGIPSVPKD